MTKILSPETKEDQAYTELGDLSIPNMKQLAAYLAANQTVRSSLLTAGTINLSQSVTDSALTPTYQLADFVGNTLNEGGSWTNGRSFTPAKILGVYVYCSVELGNNAALRSGHVQAKLFGTNDWSFIYKKAGGSADLVSADKMALIYVPIAQGQTQLEFSMYSEHCTTSIVLYGLQHRGA